MTDGGGGGGGGGGGDEDDDDDDDNDFFLSTVKYTETAWICSLLFFFHVEVLNEKHVRIFVGKVADKQREDLKLERK